MKFLPVSATNDPYLPFIKELYHASFPKEERRDWQQLLDMMDTCGEMQLQVIEEEAMAIGFIIFWVFGDWLFLEHFAVDPDLRGKSYGERIMKALMRDVKLILEVEPPSTDNAVRRIVFYERLGFSRLPFTYNQPSYSNPEESFPMVLMSNSSAQREDQFSEIISQIRIKVYACLQ